MYDMFEQLKVYLSSPFDELQATCEQLHIDAQQAELNGDHELALNIGLEYVAAHSALSAIATRQNNTVMALSAAKQAKQGMGVVIYKVEELGLPKDEACRENLKQQLMLFDQTFFATDKSMSDTKKGCLPTFLLPFFAAMNIALNITLA